MKAFPCLLGLAILYTLLNAVKPLGIDDPAYCAFAAHIAEHPADPYGFEFMGGTPANDVLAPPVMLYWNAGAIRIFGDRPFCWKLCLLPWSLLFVFSLHALFQRFARGLEITLVGMTVLSPAFLPSLNLMLDVPATALSLCALLLFLRASERASPAGALLAGVVAGLAMQTKYTAFVVPAVFLAYAVCFRQYRLGAIAALSAWLVFGSWEAWLALGQGESHFLYNLRLRATPIRRRVHLIAPLLTIAGALACPVALLGLAAQGVSRRKVLLLGVAMLSGFALLACVPESWARYFRNASTGKPMFTLNDVVFGSMALLLSWSTLAVARSLCRRPADAAEPDAATRDRRIAWFLVSWLVLEVLAALALSPFPAARRVLGVIVVLVLLAGRRAAQTCRTPDRLRLVEAVAVVGIALGFFYYAIDLHEARVEKSMAERTDRWIRDRQTDARTWYLSEWGFHFYAQRCGMQRACTESFPGPGDWFIIDGRFDSERNSLAEDGRFQLMAKLCHHDALPLRTSLCYYAGATPLKHLEGPRFTISIYRRH